MKDKRVMVIPARKKIQEGALDKEHPKLRVAAYCRVSTESEEQTGSFETQVSHYTNYINKNPDWRLVDIYADEGISGTNTKNRREFNRMIDECLTGNIDLIITKSISRFARNTLDCLKYIRQLKAKNVAVYFEKENINTLDSKGEVLITIMASLAQQESESMSKNIKLGLQYRYQQGQVKFNTTRFLGYDSDEEGTLIINQEQAKVVRRIFKEYLEGKGTGRIARGLMNDKIPTGSGKLKWSGDSINRIISNEKYMGDALLQKTYTVDFLTKARVENDGTVPQYYIEDNHEPIVSKETFNLAQQEKARRSNLYLGKKKQKRLYQGKYALSGKVTCEHCRDIFRRIKWNSRGSKSIVWRCITRVENHEKCPARTVKEDLLHEAVVDAINEFIGEKGDYFKVLEENIIEVLNNKYDETVEEVDDQLHELQKKLYQVANQKNDYERIADQIFMLREKKQELLIENATNEEKRRRWSDIKAFLKTQHTRLEEYGEGLTNRLVEGVVIKDECIEVELKTRDIINIDK
ncbi:recombinase family protein [Globicatella sulfidifaciens]|uniref:recombinase family protein n=1 Tax=Globicatella sulfidifaciens TaxID=136093 RepID=UPI00288EAC0C|nr:recombinase family protein [Globicatella sulfidifaciens]MDT2768179.1 recombinase family protein [Globicatella sulfidifaciens]